MSDIEDPTSAPDPFDDALRAHLRSPAPAPVPSDRRRQELESAALAWAEGPDTDDQTDEPPTDDDTTDDDTTDDDTTDDDEPGDATDADDDNDVIDVHARTDDGPIRLAHDDPSGAAADGDDVLSDADDLSDVVIGDGTDQIVPQWAPPAASISLDDTDDLDSEEPWSSIDDRLDGDDPSGGWPATEADDAIEREGDFDPMDRIAPGLGAAGDDGPDDDDPTAGWDDVR